MSRQEAINTFTEGMIMDLNPLTTPDSVLTDCLNGTIITYNDNEFVLQNDQGNYKLKFGQLKENFIPVGIKEHNNILYIVSYNPITKETEIGTYPSPQQVFSQEKDNSINLSPILEFYTEDDVEKTPQEKTYAELLEDNKNKLQLFITPDDLDKSFLNPDDEIKIEFNQSDNLLYQALTFYVMDETKQVVELYDFDYTKYTSDFRKISWSIPGWLAVKYRLANIDAFNLNVTEFEIPDISVGKSFQISKLKVCPQLEITDKLFLEDDSVLINKDSDHKLYIRYELSKVSMDGTEIKIGETFNDATNKFEVKQFGSELSQINYYYKNFDLTTNVNQISFTTNDKLKISAVPVLELKDCKTIVIYEQFRQDRTFKLDTTDAANFTVGNSFYNYVVTDNSVVLNFDISGDLSSKVKLEATYEIYEAGSKEEDESQEGDEDDESQEGDEDDKDNIVPIISSTKIPSINLLGQNVINIPFTDTFKKESVYTFVLQFKSKGQLVKIFVVPIITSVVMNGFKDKKFITDVYANEWFSEYNKYINIDKNSISLFKSEQSLSDTINVNTENVSSVFPSNYYMKNQEDVIMSDPEFVKVYKDGALSEIRTKPYEISLNGTATYTASGKIDFQTGELWNGIDPIGTISYKTSTESNKNTVTINSENGTISGNVTPNLKFYHNLFVNLIPDRKNVQNKFITKDYLKYNISTSDKYFPDTILYLEASTVEGDIDSYNVYGKFYTFSTKENLLYYLNSCDTTEVTEKGTDFSNKEYNFNVSLESIGNLDTAPQFWDKIYDFIEGCNIPLFIMVIKTIGDGQLVYLKDDYVGTFPKCYIVSKHDGNKINGLNINVPNTITLLDLISGKGEYGQYCRQLTTLGEHLFVVKSVNTGQFNLYTIKSDNQDGTIKNEFVHSVKWLSSDFNVKFNNPKYKGYDIFNKTGLQLLNTNISERIETIYKTIIETAFSVKLNEVKTEAEDATENEEDKDSAGKKAYDEELNNLIKIIVNLNPIKNFEFENQNILSFALNEHILDLSYLNLSDIIISEDDFNIDTQYTVFETEVLRQITIKNAQLEEFNSALYDKDKYNLGEIYYDGEASNNFSEIFVVSADKDGKYPIKNLRTNSKFTPSLIGLKADLNGKTLVFGAEDRNNLYISNVTRDET